jgi:hypothetical protein
VTTLCFRYAIRKKIHAGPVGVRSRCVDHLGQIADSASDVEHAPAGRSDRCDQLRDRIPALLGKPRVSAIGR